MELRLWESGGEFVLQARHLGESDGINGCHADFTFDTRFELVQRRLELLFAPLDVAAKVEIQLSGGGQSQGTSGSVKQRHAKLLFELVDVLAGGGLADSVVGGATADALPLSYVTEKLYV